MINLLYLVLGIIHDQLAIIGTWQVLAFFSKLRLLGMFWFLCLPVLVLFAAALPPYRRHQVSPSSALPPYRCHHVSPQQCPSPLAATTSAPAVLVRIGVQLPAHPGQAGWHCRTYQPHFP